ncbi:NADP-dependent 3-hydroxy acid dehydrogenase YdfG [Terribacillus saccharophilus]|uniref:NADP-dependent 3-hydroxy acid dehydrogenase YdfG n=1 Tax=Terribacillus saccharophilus TaxID=361277 RepID=A0AAX2ED97_9BACI|nr:NADP-dependent 3-hydroxy acid dehydrogenase YdfG [Terribacillus saccharophilus]
MSQIKDKVVVITGASSGIGENAARYLAEQGAKVVIAARSESKLQDIVEEINSENGTAAYKVTDVTDEKNVEALIDFAIDKFGHVDTLINGAGQMLFSMWENTKVDEWENMIDLNIKGTLYGIAAVLPHMKERGKGQIINVGSIAGHAVGEGHGVYSSTKYAIKAITESLRKEVSVKHGIQAALVSPGVISTNWQDSVTDKDVKGVLSNMKEVAIDTSHVSKAIAFVVDQPSDVMINDVIVTPTHQEW